MSGPRLFTVGHGTRTTDELVDVLRSGDVTRIVDVRRHPGSRRQPHLGRGALETDLPAAGIAYEWAGETLGGRRSRTATSRHPAWRNPSFQGYADHMDTAEFRTAFSALLQELPTSAATAVMCSETVWWRCHRRLLADAAVLHGVEVVHLLGADNHAAHVLHPDVRRGEDAWPVYDGGQEPLVP